jgi:hypothetical protein
MRVHTSSSGTSSSGNVGGSSCPSSSSFFRPFLTSVSSFLIALSSAASLSKPSSLKVAYQDRCSYTIAAYQVNHSLPNLSCSPLHAAPSAQSNTANHSPSVEATMYERIKSAYRLTQAFGNAYLLFPSLCSHLLQLPSLFPSALREPRNVFLSLLFSYRHREWELHDFLVCTQLQRVSQSPEQGRIVCREFTDILEKPLYYDVSY